MQVAMERWYSHREQLKVRCDRWHLRYTSRQQRDEERMRGPSGEAVADGIGHLILSSQTGGCR